MDRSNHASKEQTSRVSRRDFLRAAGSGAVLSSAAAAAVTFTESTAYAQQRWDHEADVVVIGTGGAAASAALFAHEAGANVLILEKAAVFGGTTAKSGAGCWLPNNYLMREHGFADPREDCLRYMARTAYPLLYDAEAPRLGLPENEYALLEAHYDNSALTADAFLRMGVFDAWTFWDMEDDGRPVVTDYNAQLPEDKGPRGRSLFPVGTDGRKADGYFFASRTKAALDERQVPILLEHRATRLVVNTSGEVVGIEATTRDDQTVSVRARRGVIFGSGGFTHNPDMCRDFLQGPIFGGCAVSTCEGDFVHIGGAVGATLGNMNSAWWFPVSLDQVLQIRSSFGGSSAAGDSMIVVNRLGRRCANEKRPNSERGRSHFVWDTSTCSYPNLIQFAVYDDFTRERFGSTSGTVLKPGLSAPNILSAPTLEELATQIDTRLAEVAAKTGNFRLDPDFADNMKETIVRFNQFAETGKDRDFRRGEAPMENTAPRPSGNDKPNKTMYPISLTGPYYAVMIAPGTLDTNGGPKINAKSQVVDAKRQPIPGLYGAGNCIASPAGQTYWGHGGTIGPAITFGGIAGRNAATEPVKDLA